MIFFRRISFQVNGIEICHSVGPVPQLGTEVHIENGVADSARRWRVGRVVHIYGDSEAHSNSLAIRQGKVFEVIPNVAEVHLVRINQ